MKKYFFTLILIGCWAVSGAQQMHLALTGGLMNYQGDLQDKKFAFEQGHPYFGIGAYYELSDKFFIRSAVINGKVSAHDRYSQTNYTRNLSFESQVTEFHIGLEYDLQNSYERVLVPYIFVAMAGFHFDPSATDSMGNKVRLQPLGTEGQGFFNGREKYALTQFAIPFGGGIKVAVSDNVFVRAELGLRKLFTDYLDDVSTIYIDQTALLNNNGQQAVDFAFRGDEIKPAYGYPKEGSKRGNPASKDYYYTAGLSVSFRLNSQSGMPGNGKSKTGCPVNVY